MHQYVNTSDKTHITVKDLSFSYNGHSVLENINFEVKQGEYLGIVGPNGSGKTTLVKIILGLLTPTSGSTEVLGSSQSGIGYVPQYLSETISQFPASVHEIIQTGRTAKRGMLRRFAKVDAEAVTQAVSVVGIEHLLNRRLSELSGGERQKVFIARALATEPSILVLDEPDAGVDQESQEAFYSFISSLRKKLHLTVLLISHDIDTVVREVDTMVCMNRTIVCYEKAETFLKDEYLEQVRKSKLLHASHKHHNHYV